jgi:creatinine amidohydrolase
MLLQEMTWSTVAQLPRETPAVLPIAAVEQHGHHLPLYTDSMLLGEIVKRADQAVGDRGLFAPLMWLGNSHHHLDFAGTLSSPPRCYLDLLGGLIDCLLSHGFTRILLLNGHGGNEVPGKQALFEVRQQYRTRPDLLLLYGTYWSLGPLPDRAMTEFAQQEMGHACEWETSMMLRIAPHLVGDWTGVAPVDPGNPFRPASRAWITKDRSRDGHIGYPHQASSEKGEILLEAFSRNVVQLIERMADWDGTSWDG